MFCPSCGKQLPENALFCDECGTPVSRPAQAPVYPAADAPVYPNAPVQQEPVYTGAPVYAPPVQKAPSAAEELFKNCLTALKSFFSKNPLSYLDTALSDKSLLWTILGGASILIFALGFATFTSEIGLKDLAALGLGADWGLVFLFSLLGGILTFGSTFGILWLASKFLYKKDIHPFALFNTVAYITLPLTCAYLINMLFGLIWVGLVIAVYTVAVILTFVMLFSVLRKLADGEEKTWVSVLVASVIAILAVLFTYLMLKAAVDTYFDRIFGNYSSFGDFGSWLD